jgi:hypothetical protein
MHGILGFRIIKILLFIFPFLLIACTKNDERSSIDINQLKIKTFIPFKNFLTEVRKAEYERYSKLTGSKVSNEDEFLKMRNHLVTMYEGVEVNNSFVMDSVMFIDCININSQPGLKTEDGKYLSIAQTPPAIRIRDDQDTLEAKFVSPMVDKEKKDAFGNVMYCEEGFIPMRRITLEEMIRFRTLDDFFNKGGIKGYKGLPDKE